MAGIFAALIIVAGARLEAALPKTRTISLYNIHTRETITVLYMKDGRHVPEAMERVNWALRDWRKDTPTKMDPALVDLLWEIHTELGSKEPMHIISGFRSRDTNELLRKTVGGQASESRHITGQAADVHFPDVPLKKIRYSALIRERGGVGYYPTSALPFVHVDTGNVRHWPRMPRYELALLFPNGQSKHNPADGGALTREDVQVAQVRFKDLATQLAAFHDDRRSGVASTLVADAGAPTPARPTPAGVRASEPRIALLTPPPAAPAPTRMPTPVSLPQLIAEPRIMDRPSRLMTRPSDSDRNRLAELAAAMPPPGLVAQPAQARRPQQQPFALASLTGAAPTAQTTPLTTPADPPRLAALGAPRDIDALLKLDSSFASAPAYDEEHPDELSYRPFPITPYLTETASADDPVLARMIHPEVERTLELLDAVGSAPPMRLRPGQQIVQLMWAQQFKTDAVMATPSSQGDAISSRRVKTTGQ